MSDLNLHQVIGRLGKDVDVRYTSAGKAVASFSVATSKSWKNKESGQKEEKTSWHNITAFGKLGEICGEYLRKGSQVYIAGESETDEYTDKEGVKRYSTKIIARDMKMLGGKTDNQSSGASNSNQASQPQSQAPAFSGADDNAFDQDIPF